VENALIFYMIEMENIELIFKKISRKFF